MGRWDDEATDRSWNAGSREELQRQLESRWRGPLLVAGDYRNNPEECPSTHGGGGYAVGSYWDNDAVVCGLCGLRIENPHPSGATMVEDRRTFWQRFWGLPGEQVYEPTWPDWMGQPSAEFRYERRTLEIRR